MITPEQLMPPLLKALANLGGSAKIAEMDEEVVKLEKFDEETLAVLHNPKKSNQTEISYQLAWARTYLKRAGYLENPAHGVWALTDKARQAEKIDAREVVRYVNTLGGKVMVTRGQRVVSRRQPVVSQEQLKVTIEQLIPPLIKALDNLGGSASIAEMDEKVAELENLDEETLAVLHNPETSNQTEISYRLAWARTYLKKAGYLENSARGVWALTDKARQAKKIDGSEMVQYVHSRDRKAITATGDTDDLPTAIRDSSEEDRDWQGKLLHFLTTEMKPDAFERLAQRILRESGFIDVEVTGRTGDGGIDGRGIVLTNGLISSRVAFQCKKYKGSVSASEVRDFQGAIGGRVDRGIFITTGRFTKPAVEEANRDGGTTIFLMDGTQLADKLKKLELGVKTELVEEVTVDQNWFLSL